MRAEEAVNVLDKLFTCLGSYRCSSKCEQWEPVNRKRDALERAIEALERDVPVSTGTAKSCGYCGEAVEEHWDYCPWCGQRRSKQ